MGCIDAWDDKGHQMRNAKSRALLDCCSSLPGVPILAHSSTGTSPKIARLLANTNTLRILRYGPKDALDFIDT